MFLCKQLIETKIKCHLLVSSTAVVFMFVFMPVNLFFFTLLTYCNCVVRWSTQEFNAELVQMTGDQRGDLLDIWNAVPHIAIGVPQGLDKIENHALVKWKAEVIIYSK